MRATTKSQCRHTHTKIHRGKEFSFCWAVIGHLPFSSLWREPVWVGSKQKGIQMKQLGRLWRVVPTLDPVASLGLWTLPWSFFSQSFCSCWFEIDFYHLPQKRDLTNNYKNKWNWKKKQLTLNNMGVGVQLRIRVWLTSTDLHIQSSSASGNSINHRYCSRYSLNKTCP